MLHQPILAAVRAALCDRIDDEAIRQQRRASWEISLPSHLLSAGLWLAAHGCDDAPSAGEVFFAWGPSVYRRYLDRLSADQRTAELAAGHRAIFDGRGGRPPLLERFPGRIDGFYTDAA